MIAGTPFNPSFLLSTRPLPTAFFHDIGLSPTAKILYTYLLLFSKSLGFCSISQPKLAQDLSLSLSQIKKTVRLLKDQKYIKIVRFRRNSAALFYFLWHKNFSASLCVPERFTIDPELHLTILSLYPELEKKR